MQLRQGEIILRTVKRHITPYVLRIFKIILLAIPVYIIVFLISNEFDNNWFTFIIFALISFFIGIIITVISLDYLLDRILVTNKRVVWINWKSLFKKEEHETDLLDIQDIETREKGILSKLKVFDYGFLEVETAAAKTCIQFEDCPDPKTVKHFILEQMEKVRGGVHEKQQPITAQNEWSVN